jgi:hypothetical protein
MMKSIIYSKRLIVKSEELGRQLFIRTCINTWSELFSQPLFCFHESEQRLPTMMRRVTPHSTGIKPAHPIVQCYDHPTESPSSSSRMRTDPTCTTPTALGRIIVHASAATKKPPALYISVVTYLSKHETRPS